MSKTNPTPTQQGGTLLPCWCREDTAYLRVKSHMDHGEFGCHERGRYVYCPNCWACGPTYTNDKEAIEGWNRSRRAAVAGPRGDVDGFCWVCRSHHVLIAAKCPAMSGIA